MRRIIKYFFITLNVLVVVLFLIGCLLPVISAARFPSTGFIGIIFPYMVILLIFLFLFWLMAKPKLVLIPAIALLIGWKQIRVLFAVHFNNNEFVQNKNKNNLRIVTWNVRSFNGAFNNKKIIKTVREDIAESIIKLHADVVCLQEFNTTQNKESQANNMALFAKQYPYYFFSKDYSIQNKQYRSGCIIFSKYPIIDSGKIKYKLAESLINIDILKDDDTVRIYTTHLQSFKFKKEDYDEIANLQNAEETSIIRSKNVIKKMNLAFKLRGEQANIVKNEISKSPYPTVICGDFNDVPNSYVYHHIKQNFQDAFLQKSWGVGKTYNALAPMLRIDYILCSNNFTVSQFDMVDENLSDHILLVSDLKLKK